MKGLEGNPEAEEQIASAADVLGLALSLTQRQRLVAFLAMLLRWNRVYNLTSLREPGEMLTHHLYDSMAVVRPLQREWARHQLAAVRSERGEGVQRAAPGLSILDVGSGAGLPGVVLAICCPQAAVTCVDTVAKKTAFIQQVALEVQLPNLSALHARVETLQAPQHQFDVACSRAFASLADFTNWSGSALAPHGIWMALKGKRPDAELSTLGQEVEVFHVEPLRVPGLDAERCVVWMRKTPS